MLLVTDAGIQCTKLADDLVSLSCFNSGLRERERERRKCCLQNQKLLIVVLKLAHVHVCSLISLRLVQVVQDVQDVEESYFILLDPLKRSTWFAHFVGFSKFSKFLSCPGLSVGNGPEAVAFLEFRGSEMLRDAQRCSEGSKIKVFSLWESTQSTLLLSYDSKGWQDARTMSFCECLWNCFHELFHESRNQGVYIQQSSVQKLTSQTIGSKPDRPRIFTFCYFCSYLINLFNLVAFPFVDIRLCSLPPDGRTPDDTLGILFLAQRASNQCQNGKTAEALGRQL